MFINKQLNVLSFIQYCAVVQPQAHNGLGLGLAPLVAGKREWNTHANFHANRAGLDHLDAVVRG